MQQKMKYAHMNAAHGYAKCSHARRLKVGAILVKDDTVISIGYNGTRPGEDNNCEDELPDGTLVTKPNVIHAEQNVLDKLAKKGGGADGSSMFITISPCLMCSQRIANTGVKAVYYEIEYRNTDGIDYLRHHDVHVEKLAD